MDRRAGWEAMLLVALGCNGAIGDRGKESGTLSGPENTASGPGGSDKGGPGSGLSSVAQGRSDPSLGDYGTAIGLRRLTKFEYGNTVHDLLGVAGAEATLNDGDSVAFLSNNAHVLKVGLSDLEAYERAAEQVSTSALNGLALPSGCTLDKLDSACVQRLLPDFLLHAFRRPSTSAEQDRYLQLYSAIAQSDSPAESLRSVLESVLLSPHFLYRDEVGSSDRLDSYAVASRLSYLLWGTMPDAALFEEARKGTLLEPTAVEAQARRMIIDARAQNGVVRFASEWLGFGKAQIAKKGADIIGGLPATLQQDLEEETRRFVSQALLGPAHSLTELFTSRTTFVNETLAGIYGLPGVTGQEFRSMELDGSTRRGVLTQPLLIAAHSKESGFSVVQMGRFVRERLLCQEVSPPPPGVKTQIDDTPATSGLPYREKLSMHANNPSCAGCHEFLDPPGFAYLPYDPVGRFRKADPQGNVFVTSGTLTNIDGASAEFADAASMIDLMTNSKDAHGCFTRMYVQYAFGRTLAQADVSLYHQLANGLDASGGDFIGMVAALVRSPDFGKPGPQL